MFQLASGVHQCLVVGSSTETKPTPVLGHIFLEIDTGSIYQVRNNEWFNASVDAARRAIARPAIIEVEETIYEPEMYPIFATAVFSALYTPILTNIANISASTAFACQWMRVDFTVTVSGKVDIDPILTGADTILGISLPIASILTTQQQCAGVAWSPLISNQGAAILSDVPNPRARMQWRATNTTLTSMYFIFTYRLV